MKYGLGIDTGGTYTDAVIYDFDTNDVISYTKSLTIKENLILGIKNVLKKLPSENLKKVSLVSLSTTLATNAAVEQKVGRGVLIFIGCDPQIVNSYAQEYGIEKDQPIIMMNGGHNQNGEKLEEPDWDRLKKEVMKYKGHTDAFAVVEKWSTHNPEFEIKSKKLINEWTNLPVVCGHELTGQLGFLKRGATTLLNAQLTTIINDFMNAVKVNLKDFGINAPLVIVRGDGSLMSEDFAREKAVETLLSGPASSVIGAIKLAKRKNCVVVDIGGTTSDISIIKNNLAELAEDGVRVGQWRTGTKAINLRTIGLGGDSLVSFDQDSNLTIGPRRVAPLCWLADKYPEIVEEMKDIKRQKRLHTHSLCEFYFIMKKDISNYDLTEHELKIYNSLKIKPLSIETLAKSIGSSIYQLRTERLESYGIIMKSALTPTDVMHIKGIYTEWNKDASILATEIMCFRLGQKLEELCDNIFKTFERKLFTTIIEMFLEKEDLIDPNKPISKDLKNIMNASFDKDNYKFIQALFNTDFSLIGIGAPTHVFLPKVAEAFNTECVLSKYSSVANAIGAITGDVTVEENVEIIPRYKSLGIEGYDIHSKDTYKFFKKYDDALVWAKDQVQTLAEEEAKQRGIGNYKIFVDVNNSSSKIFNVAVGDNEDSSEENLLLKTIISARVIGSLKY